MAIVNSKVRRQQTASDASQDVRAANQAANDIAPIIPTTNTRSKGPEPAQQNGPRPPDQASSQTPRQPKPPMQNNASGIPPPAPTGPNIFPGMGQVGGLNPGIGSAISNGATGQQKTPEQLYQDALNSLLSSGPRDTSQEEKLLREQMLKDAGAGQANLNARMGASGFGTSGALSSLSTDMRSKAAFDAANSIQGVRKDARDEYLDKVSAGLGFVNQDRGLDITEANYQAYIDAMNEIFGGEPPPNNDVDNVIPVETETLENGVIQPKGGYAGQDGDFMHWLYLLSQGKV